MQGLSTSAASTSMDFVRPGLRKPSVQGAAHHGAVTENRPCEAMVLPPLITSATYASVDLVRSGLRGPSVQDAAQRGLSAPK